MKIFPFHSTGLPKPIKTRKWNCKETIDQIRSTLHTTGSLYLWIQPVVHQEREAKIPEISKKQNLNWPCTSNYFILFTMCLQLLT